MKLIVAAIFSLLVSFGLFSEEITLTADNKVSFRMEVNSTSVMKAIQDIQKLDANLKSGYPIYLVLYTPGGSIEDGLELIQYLEGVNRPIYTITVFAASMGFQFVQHLGKRYILKYGTLMSHKARGGFSGEFGGGYSQLDSRYGQWLRLVDMMDKVTVERTNGKQTLRSYRAAYENELWLNGPEAVKQGYADAVATVKCDVTLRGGEKEVLSVNFGRAVVKVEVEFPKCPILTQVMSVRMIVETNQGEMYLDDFVKRNGQFGVDCTIGNTSQENLCALDKALTLDLLKNAKKEQMSKFNKNLKKNVTYSY